MTYVSANFFSKGWKGSHGVINRNGDIQNKEKVTNGHKCVLQVKLARFIMNGNIMRCIGWLIYASSQSNFLFVVHVPISICGCSLENMHLMAVNLTASHISQQLYTVQLFWRNEFMCFGILLCHIEVSNTTVLF